MERRVVHKTISWRENLPYIIPAALLMVLDFVFFKTYTLWLLLLPPCIMALIYRLMNKNQALEYDEYGLVWKSGKKNVTNVPWEQVRSVYIAGGPLDRNMHVTTYLVCIEFLEGSKKRKLKFNKLLYYGVDEFYEFASEALKRRSGNVESTKH